MATSEELKNANRLTSLTYMVAACLNFSIEELNHFLSKTNLELHGKDKQLFNYIKSQLNKLKFALKDLENLAFKGMGEDEEAKLSYEDAIHIYWAAFITLIDRGGIDNLCDIRLMALVDKISRYESLLNFPDMATIYNMAFMQIRDAIESGKYSKEDFKSLLKVKESIYESKIEETKG